MAAVEVPPVFTLEDVEHEGTFVVIGSLGSPPVQVAAGFVEWDCPARVSQPGGSACGAPSSASVDHSRGDVVDRS